MPAEIYACNLGRAFAETAARHGVLPAIHATDGIKVSYADLDALSNRLARWLLARHAGPGNIVALQNGKSPEGYAAMLACLKVGAAYTNLDVQNPPERLGHILSVCRPLLVLCDESPAPALVEAAGRSSVPVAVVGDYVTEIGALEGTAPSGLPEVTGTEP